MSNFGGKYFEEIIARLIKAKEAENYQMRSAFKAELRNKLLEGPSVAELPEVSGFDWGVFWSKWKYALGVVPTMAILTVVAINAFDQKVVMDQPEQAFQSTLQKQVSNQMEIGSLENSNEVSDVNMGNTGIKTFPGYLVMPSDEVLKNFRRAEDGVMNVPAMNSNLTELKIDNPQTQLEKINFDGSKLLPPADMPAIESEVRAPANANVVMIENTNLENSQEDGVSDDLANQSFVQENPVVETAPVQEMSGGMGGGLPENIDQATALDVGNTLLTESLSVEEVKQEVEKENALRQLNTQQINVDSQQVPVQQTGEMDLANFQFNVVDEYNRPSQYKPEINLNQQLWFNNALMEGGRVYYEGEKDQLLRAFVNSEIVARAGLLSGDYYYEGQDLEPGVIKLTLWEFGQKSKIYILKEEPYGLRVVTEVDFK